MTEKKGRYDMILLFCHPALDAGSLQQNRQGYRLGGRYDRKKGRYDRKKGRYDRKKKDGMTEKKQQKKIKNKIFVDIFFRYDEL